MDGRLANDHPGHLVVLNSHYALCSAVAAGLFIYQRFLLSMTLNLHGQVQIKFCSYNVNIKCA